MGSSERVLTVIVAALSGFALALAAPWLSTIGRGRTGWLIALLPLGLTGYFISYIEPVSVGAVFTETYAWVPSLGVSLSFYLDGLSLLFALLISALGALIFIYSDSYLAGHHHQGRFYAYLLMFMASMLGVVLAGNVLALYIFWELTSLSSYLLIGFTHEKEETRAAAWQALLVTNAGGLALLAGLLLLGQAGGSVELSVLLSQGDVVRAHPLYLPLLLLILAGAFTKSAQFPFHFWLPSAMQAPTPVSAYLHSATMVKAGVYLLARLNPVLGDTDAWGLIVTMIGAVTMLISAYLTVQQIDAKLILAYATVSLLGMLTMLLGLGSRRAVEAAMTYLLAHALYKGALFLVVGVVDHAAGARTLDQLRGLGRAMPITAAAAALAALSMAGIPPLLGYLGKEKLYEATLEASSGFSFLIWAAVLTSLLFVVAAVMVGIQPFMGKKTRAPHKPHEAAASLWLSPLLLAGAGLCLGWWPELITQPLVSPAVAAVLGRSTEVTLQLWHGVTLVFTLSVMTVAVGLGLYYGRGVLSWLNALTAPLFRWGPAWWYEKALTGLFCMAHLQTGLLQNGSLRIYLFIVIAALLAVSGYTFVSYAEPPPLIGWSNVFFYELGLAVLILLATGLAVRSRSRLGVIVPLGVVGYSVALFFIFFGAPDLAKTQILIETLTVIFFIFVLQRLPRFAALQRPLRRTRDLCLALAVGVWITALVLAVSSAPVSHRLAHYFTEHSVPAAHGRNIVNVILVDFRSFDTLGEITVFAIAGLGVYALLKWRTE